MTFAPVPRQTAASQCAAVLRRRILDGRLPADRRLPPERELAQQLGVTRVTLRSALQFLAAEGLIEQVQGRGTTVRDWRAAGGPGLLGAVLALQSEGAGRVAAVADLLAVRRAVAGVVFEKLAVAEVDVAPIAACIDELERCAVEPVSIPAVARADLGVLAALLEACQSAVLPLCLQPISRALRALPELCAVIYREPRANVAGWRAVQAWLAMAPEQRGDAAPALALLEARDAQTLALLRLRVADDAGVHG